MKIKNFYIENFNLLSQKLKKILNLAQIDDFSRYKKIICVGSGASYSTAYFVSKILKNFYNINVVSMKPRELLNEKINNDDFIIIFSYSGTSKDTKYISKKYPNSLIVTGRNANEFNNTKNIYSYYTGYDYERGIVLYENLFIPITIILKLLPEFNEIIEYEINNIYKNEKYLNDYLFDIKSIAIFTGDYCQTATLDFEEKLLETGICKYKIYDKKDFSHGQYSYFKNENYDVIIYLKQKNISDYEKKLIKFLRGRNVPVLIVESKFNKFYAEYDLLYKINKLFNEILSLKNIQNFYLDDKAKKLYDYEGDFS